MKKSQDIRNLFESSNMSINEENSYNQFTPKIEKVSIRDLQPYLE